MHEASHTQLRDLDADALQSIFNHLGAKDLANLAAINFVPGLIVDMLQQRAPPGDSGLALAHTLASSRTQATPATQATRLARLEWRRTEAHMPVAACTTRCMFVAKRGQLMIKHRDFYAEFGHELWLQAHDGSLTPIPSNRQPEYMHDTEGDQFTSVYYKNKYYAAVSNAGQVYTWSGENTPALVHTLSTRILSVAIGLSHILAVAENGHVFSWGQDNNAGKLGYTLHAPRHTQPKRIQQPRRIEALRGVAVRSASAGNHHSLVVTEEGELYTFGYVYGQNASRIARLPEKVDALPLGNLRIKATAAGSYHSLALTHDGMVLSWGYDHGQLGRPRKGRTQAENTLTQEISFIPFAGAVRSVGVSYDTSCAVTTDGKLFVWGRHYGKVRPFSRAPKLVEALRDHDVAKVSIDKNHIVVTTTDHEVIGMDLAHALSPQRRFMRCD
jgi:hypothetical protein